MTGYTDEYLPFYDATIAGLLGTWNYTAYIYIAFDSPTTASPAWIDVTGYVDLDQSQIPITRGRADGLADVQVGTCTLTVDNSDGRWSQFNPAGAWYGKIRKGSWLRVDVMPPSGTVSTRFVGFIQRLPVSWSGRYPMAKIQAADRFAPLSNAKPFNTAIFEEWMSDPVGAQYINAYFPLHDPVGSTYVSDASGQAANGQRSLTVRSYGVNPGAGITFANTQAPGYDGVSTVTFAPTGSYLPSVYGGNTGALSDGSYLIGEVGPNGGVADISFWINTPIANQPILSWSDPSQNYAMGIDIWSNGHLNFWQAPLSGIGSPIFNFSNYGTTAASAYPIDDGAWHLVSVRIQTAAASGGDAYVAIALDGRQIGYGFQAASMTAGFAPPATLNRLIVGGAEGWNGDTTIGNLAFFTGSLSDLVVHVIPNKTINPDWYGAYQAATGMWQSPNIAYSRPESCGRRIIRLARYAGIPTPTFSFGLPGNGNPVYDVALGATPFINIAAETGHLAGPQQLAGTTPLTAMLTAAHTENMPLFIDRQGRITLQPSTLRQNPTAAAFTINAADLDPATEWADDFQYFANQAVITPSGQGSLTVNTNGTTSQNLNGLYSKSLDTITVSMPESASLGAAINYAGSNPPPRIAPLTCEAATLATQAGYGAAWYDAVLAADISTVIQITNWPTGTPGPSSGTYYIEGYTETLGMGTHTFAWNTTVAQGATYQCDSPTLGVIDTPGLTLAY